ncbi:Qat anti-phage system ATPase QatA [Pedobacter nutrimenti]|uniref:Putative KAP-like P-loop ATPase n=1 Tax=Pedobacter nutrimenti TaxID=1241337 RepID=A0A318U7Z3_9SPHI|nr:Qat anti-phage system ATPase QatA [Pedobacter nutrimenti]PYF70585.1 putative KAP-like P-loop ATPase [Pedobacter nutrimenti]
MWNDKETDIDLLDHEKIAQTVIEITSDNHLRPLTIGIYGDWGVGKSSVLSLLQSEIKKQNKAQLINAHTIMFNGWLFQGYEDAKTALMETVVSELAKLQPRNVKIQNLAKSLIKRVNWLKVAKVSANAVLTGVTGIPMGSVLGGISSFIKKGKQIISPGEADSNSPFESGEDGFLKDVEEETVTDQIQAFRKEFIELIKKSKVDQVIVLVDDLDRCLPKSVIEILEAIRLFLFVEGTTFIISADEKMIEYAVREHFPNLPASYSEYTKNYLEKLIQIPIRIPLLNQLQTGNYIKFLMLQFHLKNDFIELKKIYELFVSKRKTPYENFPLTYEVIQDALNDNTTELKKTLLIADRLGPTLTNGLKGNPRNIKRFLNTLFLRMRISKIYGLQDNIELGVLAKLMLLERFETEIFEKLVSEVVSTEKGISETVKTIEGNLDKLKSEQETETESQLDELNFPERLVEWVKIEPILGDTDLRPYVFISKEKAIGLQLNDELSPRLLDILEKLNSNSDMALNTVAKALPDLDKEEAIRLYEILENESRSSPNLKELPKQIKGLLKLIQCFPALEIRVVKLLSSYPPGSLGVWAISQLAGLKEPSAQQEFSLLLRAWSTQTENKILKDYAVITLKQNK